MRAWLFLLIVLRSAAPAGAAELAPSDHVGNVTVNGYGLCWFACAETIGRAERIPGLPGTIAALQAPGAYCAGAAPEAIAYWMQRRGVDCATHSGVGMTWLAERTQVAPVVACMRVPGSALTHAVVALGVTAREVRYYDPNYPGRTWTRPREEFRQRWTAEAWTFPAPVAPELPGQSARPSSGIVWSAGPDPPEQGGNPWIRVTAAP
jgi:hypothetical protein